MKFKVGDKVRVLSEPYYTNPTDLGKVFEVVKITPQAITEDLYQLSNGVIYLESRLEPVEKYKTDAEIMQELIEGRNDKPKVSITLGEFLEVQEQERDAIQPPHYNKGEIDLFESAYRTRPFNEFRAIMEFIAERYMKRDKENRIEDLGKAIYTLERLKEYEELEEEE